MGKVIYTSAGFLFYILVCIPLTPTDKKSASYTLRAGVRTRWNMDKLSPFFYFSLGPPSMKLLAGPNGPLSEAKFIC